MSNESKVNIRVRPSSGNKWELTRRPESPEGHVGIQGEEGSGKKWRLTKHKPGEVDHGQEV